MIKPLSTIPMEHQSLIRTALEKTVGKADWDLLTPITGGMSGGSIYKVKMDSHVFVARISAPNHWGSILKNEYTNMINASDVDVSPKVYFNDAKKGIVLMHYINSQPVNELISGNQQHARALADLISRMHQCPDFSSGPTFFEIAQQLVQQLSEEYIIHPLVYQSGKLLKSLEQFLSDPKDMRPSHRDMNPNNLLFDGNYYLVDWEAAAQDNLYLDLATCINYFFYDKTDTAQSFLEHYFGMTLSSTQQYKLHLMRIASLIYAGTNFLMLAAKSKQPLLSNEQCEQLPSYSTYMKLIGNSKCLSDPLVHQEYGFVCFKEMWLLMNHSDYSGALKRLGSK